MATPNKNRALPGSERPLAPGAELAGPVKPGERVRFTMLLRPRPDGPPSHDLEHWRNTPPGKRNFLSVDEFFNKYGAAAEEVAVAIEFLRSENLRVIESHSGRRRIEVEGAADDVNRAFGIRLNLYRAPRRIARRPIGGQVERPADFDSPIREEVYRGFEGLVHLPARLDGIVTAVIGLDNRQFGGPALSGTGDPPSSQYLAPATVNSLGSPGIAQLYDFPTTAAAGQTVAIFEAADPGNDAAYLHSDIHAYIASLPAGHNVQPNLTDIGLLGYTNNPGLVTSGPDVANNFWGGVYENALDVSVVAAVAQGANINVYFTENTEAGWEAFLDRAIFPLPTDNAPSVITASWILTIGDDTGTIGSLSSSSSIASVLSGKLQSAAMRGITVFMAIGDWGSANQNFDGNCHVSYPNSDPWITSCGGTIIGDITSPAAFEEWTWSDANTFSQFQSGLYVATGGGVSDSLPIPSYQTAAGILPISKNDGSVRRGVPDVAGMVAMDGFFINGSGGPGQNQLFGTSAVAPLYAGLVAMINAFLGHNVGFLNPTLYEFGPEICRDIKIGDNLSGYTPAPFYATGIEWDPCTGWGSIDGLRLLSALAPAPILETAIAAGGFGSVCVGSFVDEILTINDTGFDTLLITGITSSSVDFAAPSVTSYPLAVGPGESMDVVVRFKPGAPAGVKSARLTIASNDLFSPHVITVSGTAQTPSLSLVIADSGSFGNVCVGSFADQPLILNNSSQCALAVSAITSSSPGFLTPLVSSYPLVIAGGDSLAVPIRFQPTAIGSWPGTLTVSSDDPHGPHSITVSGDAPSGTIAVTGSTHFGGVKACCCVERTLAICNVGDCKLHVSSVAFKRKSKHWKLIDNPFPATLHPGSCLSVIIRYKATERCSRGSELVIVSDDAVTPVKTLELCAYTIWTESCGCDGCKKGCCEKQCCEPCCDPCACEEEDDEQ